MPTITLTRLIPKEMLNGKRGRIRPVLYLVIESESPGAFGFGEVKGIPVLCKSLAMLLAMAPAGLTQDKVVIVPGRHEFGTESFKAVRKRSGERCDALHQVSDGRSFEAYIARESNKCS